MTIITTTHNLPLLLTSPTHPRNLLTTPKSSTKPALPPHTKKSLPNPHPPPTELHPHNRPMTIITTTTTILHHLTHESLSLPPTPLLPTKPCPTFIPLSHIHLSSMNTSLTYISTRETLVHTPTHEMPYLTHTHTHTHTHK